MAYGLLTYDENGVLQFDSRKFNLLYLQDVEINEADLNSLIPMNTNFKLALFIEPDGAIGEKFKSIDLWDYSETDFGLTGLACPNNIIPSYSSSSASIFVSGFPDSSYLADFRPTIARVFHYGVDIV